MASRRSRLIEAPLAVASDGSLLINAYWLSAGGTSLEAIIQAARKSGEKLFIGLVVPQRWKGRIVADLDELALDTVGRLGLQAIPRLRQRPRRSKGRR